MVPASRGFWRTLAQLVLALCNATLILLALCLWLAWQVSDAAHAVVTELGQRLTALDPLRSEIAGLTAEVTQLRQNLAAINAANPVEGDMLSGVPDRLAALDARMEQAGDALDRLAAAPESLVDRAVDRAVQSLRASVATALDCKQSAGG